MVYSKILKVQNFNNICTIDTNIKAEHAYTKSSCIYINNNTYKIVGIIAMFVRHDFHVYTEYTNTYDVLIITTIVLVPNPAGNRPLNSWNMYIYIYLFSDRHHI